MTTLVGDVWTLGQFYSPPVVIITEIPQEILEPFAVDLSRGLRAILMFSVALRLDEH